MRDILATINFLFIILLIAVAFSGAVQLLAALVVLWGIVIVILNTLLGSFIEPVKKKKRL